MQWLSLSLLCESFVAEWMYNDISTKIDLQQYGNVRGSSTTLCLIDFLNFIYEELEKRKTAVTATFIDFKKAFDLVDHNIVIKKAIALGVRECIIPWIADFLSGRRQSVRYLGAMSDFLPTTCGVPQGTILGSLCFLVLINDALLDTSLRWKYVDDCTFAISINTDSPDHAPLQQTLDTLQQWSDSNHMSINPSKTVVLNFSVSITPLPPLSLTLGDHTLDCITSTRILGLTVDDKLNWNQHTNNTLKAASFRLYMLRRLKTFGMPTLELISIYKTFILPKLTYASPAWSCSLTDTQLRRLERVQKRALKISLGANYSTYEEALVTANLQKLEDIYKENQRRLARKLMKDSRHRHLLPVDAPPPAYYLRHANTIVPNTPRTERYLNSPIPSLTSIINEY